MLRILVFILLSSPLMGRTDSLRYDKWIGWVNPASMFHFYHPAVELGAEYRPGKNIAYMVNYGWDIALKKYIPYHGQQHQYLRVGVKKYSRKKAGRSYLMGDLGLFHLLHYGSQVSWKGHNAIEDSYVYTRFHEFLFKPRINVGTTLRTGRVRWDVYTGLGLRFGMRKHRVIDASDYPSGPRSHIFGMISPAENIIIDSPSGWGPVLTVPFLSLGVRMGMGFGPVTVMAGNSLPD